MDRLEALIAELKTFVEEREWSQFHENKPGSLQES